MAGTTTAFCTSCKQELMQAIHCWNAAQAGVTASITNTSTSVTGISSTLGLSVGMAVTGTGIAANTVIAAISSLSALTLSIAATASNASASLTFTADALKVALVKVSPGGTYGAATTNYSNLTGNTDEVVSGGGYTTGGTALTNVTPAQNGNPTTSANVNFSPNPSWTSATFSTTGCMFYNTNGRGGAATTTPITNRAIGIFDFSGTQSVTSGTLTLVMPVSDGTTGIVRVD